MTERPHGNTGDAGNRGNEGDSKDREDGKDRGETGDWGRDETPEERADRRWSDLLQELRAATTGVLVAPAAMHRLLTGRRLKPETVAWASRLTVVGLFLLLCTTTCSLLLVLRLVVPDTLAAWLAGGLVLWFTLCWLAVPLWAVRRARRPAAERRA
jgi:hypothetical protein